jgi:hypothetical protein
MRLSSCHAECFVNAICHYETDLLYYVNERYFFLSVLVSPSMMDMDRPVANARSVRLHGGGRVSAGDSC